MIRDSIVSLIVGFLVGLLATAINAYRTSLREKRALAAQFVTHIKRVALDVDQAKMVPDGVGFTRGRTELFGVKGLDLKGPIELRLDLDDIQFWENQGVRLAGLLRARTSRQVWECYVTLRQVNAVRAVVQEMPDEDRDKNDLLKVHRQLVERYGRQLSALERPLDWESMNIFQRVFELVTVERPNPRRS